MKLLSAALFASSLIVSTGLISIPASARSAVTVDFGNVGIGYRDGYYDRGHQYHRWARHDADAYRVQYRQNYRDTYHYRDRNRSWNR